MWGNKHSMIVKNLKAVEQELGTWGTMSQCLICSGAKKKGACGFWKSLPPTVDSIARGYVVTYKRIVLRH